MAIAIMPDPTIKIRLTYASTYDVVPGCPNRNETAVNNSMNVSTARSIRKYDRAS